MLPGLLGLLWPFDLWNDVGAVLILRAVVVALKRSLWAIPMKPFASHLGRWVVRPWTMSFELLIICRDLSGGSDLVAQHNPASSPIRRDGVFTLILSAIFHFIVFSIP